MLEEKREGTGQLVLSEGLKVVLKAMEEVKVGAASEFFSFSNIAIVSTNFQLGSFKVVILPLPQFEASKFLL